MKYKPAIMKYTNCLLDPNVTNLINANVFYSSREGDFKNRGVALELIQYAIEDYLGWTPQEAAERFNRQVVSELKLDDAITKLDLPDGAIVEDNFSYVLNMIYPSIPVNLTDLTIKYYKYILDGNNNKSFTRRYFSDIDGKKRAVICLHYLIERNASFFNSIEDMYSFFSTVGGDRFLTKNKLNMAKQIFSSNTEYLHYSLSKNQQDQFLFHYYQAQELFWATKRKIAKIGRAKEKIANIENQLDEEET